MDDAVTPLAVNYRIGADDRGGLSSVSGKIRFVSLLLAAAIGSALPALLFLCLKLALPLVIAGLLQGLLLGFFLRSIFRNARLRNKSAALMVSLSTCLLAIAVLHTGFFLWDVFLVYRRFAGSGAGIRPFALYNLVLQLDVGRGGIAGYAIMRLRNSAYMTATFVHALVTPIMAWRLVKEQATSAYCQTCSKWIDKSVNALVLPAGLAKPLVEAVRSGEVERALALARIAADLPLGNSCAVARLYECKTCGEPMIDVIQKSFGRRGGNLALLKPTVVTKGFAAALRSDPVVAVEEPADEASEAEENESSPAEQ
jgi:hypothetical protein